MQTYFVSWEINIAADSPQAAAAQAFAHMQRPGTTCTVFSVSDGSGEAVTVDLLDDAA